jgi:hypothetical protein
MRRFVPVAVACLSGLIVLLGYWGDGELLGNAPNLLIEAAAFLASLALLMGAAHLAATHGRRALGDASQGAEARRGFSAVLAVALVVTFAVGVLLPGSATLAWIFDHLYTPLQATMTALLAFFIVSGAYRAFRLGRAGAGVLLAASLFLLLAQLPISQRLSPYIPALRDWTLAVPVTAGVRGILLGAALGIVAATLRILTGIDRPHAQE